MDKKRFFALSVGLLTFQLLRAIALQSFHSRHRLTPWKLGPLWWRDRLLVEQVSPHPSHLCKNPPQSMHLKLALYWQTMPYFEVNLKKKKLYIYIYIYIYINIYIYDSEKRDKPCAACFWGGGSSTGFSKATQSLDLVCWEQNRTK